MCAKFDKHSVRKIETNIARFNFMLKTIKKLLRRKLDPVIQKQMEKPKFHLFGFSICVGIPRFNFRLINLFLCFQHEIDYLPGFADWRDALIEGGNRDC